jgi:hypothetical protein
VAGDIGTDEPFYWLELVRDTGLVKPELLSGLMNEANGLTAILLVSRKTAKTRPRTTNRKSTIENRQL